MDTDSENECEELLTLKLKYIILHPETVYEPKDNSLEFLLNGVTFKHYNISDIFSHSYAVKLSFQDIDLLRYALDKSLLCLTISNTVYSELYANKNIDILSPCNIWFCLDVPDIKIYQDTYSKLINEFSDLVSIKPMENKFCETFMNEICSGQVNKFIGDWSEIIEPLIEIMPHEINAPPELYKGCDKVSKLIYSPNCDDTAELILADLFCLKRDTPLNDSIIHFYLLYIYHEVLDHEQRNRSYFFNLFFNTKLMGSAQQQQTDTPETRHTRVAKWTKKIDIFSKDFLIIPIIEEGFWFVAVVCFPWMAGMVDYGELLNQRKSNFPNNDSVFAKETRHIKLKTLSENSVKNPMPCILCFNSMSEKSRAVNLNIIRQYLQSEWDSRRLANDGPLVFDKSTCRLFNPQISQLTFTGDSGIYMLGHVEKFFTSPLQNFSVESCRQLLVGWGSDDWRNKRREIYELITKTFFLL